MKKILCAIAIISLTAACKKSTEDPNEITSKVYLQIEGIDNDNVTTTVSTILTVNVKQ